jgi:lipopolysaccharide/colanic/teichoic acid biosynthesis glycosyltransferase
MLLTALAIWLEDGFPVIYRQERVGENGRPFTLYKFRSMRKDAEGETPVWASDQDDRVTRSGGRSGRRGSTSCRSCGTCCAAT